LVDLANWQVEGSWAWSPESGLLVSDDGTVYLAGSGQFQRLRLGETVPEEVARLPSGFRPWMICPIFVGAFAIFGTRFQSGESASIVSIDMPRVGGREPDSKPSTSHRARSLPDRGRGQPQHVRSIGVLHADTGTFTP
jgi:hypothetical protein